MPVTVLLRAISQIKFSGMSCSLSAKAAFIRMAWYLRASSWVPNLRTRGVPAPPSYESVGATEYALDKGENKYPRGARRRHDRARPIERIHRSHNNRRQIFRASV